MPDRFALLIPCKNGARFLPRLLASASAQTRSFDEVLLFDDGSDDDSGRLAADFGAKVLRSENSIGPGAARNRLATACACEWLHFHDADDELHPAYLAAVATRAVPGIDVVVCDMTWVDEASGQLENQWTYDAAALERQAASYLITNTIGGINGLYRKTAFDRIGGFRESLAYWEDMDLNVRLAAAGSRFDVVNQSLVTAYRRRESYSNSNLTEAWRCKLRLMQGWCDADADKRLRATIAREAEDIAARFLAQKLNADVADALRLARRAGGNPPTTHNPAMRCAKHVLPTGLAFRLQARLRQIRAR